MKMVLDLDVVPLVASNFDLLCDVIFKIFSVCHSNVGD
jgi:hypothetical protein